MTQKLLTPEVQAFIKAQAGNDLSRLALGKNPFPEIPFAEILNQIKSRVKAKDKLPTWFDGYGILFPEPISIEQASSEQTASYKASLVSGKLIDLTGGFGIDACFFSKTAEKVWHCERNHRLSEIVTHNFSVLNAQNIVCVSGDSSKFLTETDIKFDWIYVDPSRRHETKGKVFKLSDCEPNAPDELSFWLSKAPNILIKTAPLLDLSAALSELANVKTVHIVALKGEVRELLWQIERGFAGNMQLIAVDLSDGKIFQTEFGKVSQADYSQPLKYLYEPNSALMKTGAFSEIGKRFGLMKLHQHSHLYTSDEIVDFPGRVFTIEASIAYNKQSMKEISGTKLNITTRNFPESVETLRKKWKLSDGGETYAFFTTDTHNDKIVLLCKKIDA